MNENYIPAAIFEIERLLERSNTPEVENRIKELESTLNKEYVEKYWAERKERKFKEGFYGKNR